MYMQRSGAYLRFALVAVAALLAALYAISPGRQGPAADAVPDKPRPLPAEARATDLAAEEETRRAAMLVAYADLEKDRLLLNRQLGSLNAKLWGLRLPAARAQSIQHDMMGAQTLLSSPPLLGAFMDVAGIRRERERVLAARDRLDQVEEELLEGARPRAPD